MPCLIKNPVAVSIPEKGSSTRRHEGLRDRALNGRRKRQARLRHWRGGPNNWSYPSIEGLKILRDFRAVPFLN
jgi:hypothetical protein